MKHIFNVALTFDDGYVDHAPVARVLHELEIRATFFLITGLKQLKGRPLLTSHPELIREMSEMGHEIGSHTLSHPNLLNTTDNQLEEELRESKSYLQALLGHEILGLAYPYGKFDERVKNAAARHYKYARKDHRHGGRDRYEVGVQCGYRGLGVCSLWTTLSMLTGGSGATLLFHSISTIPVRVWCRYLKAIGAHFVTLSELVDIEYP
jgi:peptidoglycan/xylan/chitin deacetylase (PgdA/CDA1 family)